MSLFYCATNSVFDQCKWSALIKWKEMKWIINLMVPKGLLSNLLL